MSGATHDPFHGPEEGCDACDLAADEATRLWDGDVYAHVTTVERLAEVAAIEGGGVMAQRTVSVTIADTPAVKAAILAAYEQGWVDGYGQGRDDEADGQPVRSRAEIVTETVHAGPPDGSAVTACCGQTPFELPRTDRMTYLSALVTCGAAR